MQQDIRWMQRLDNYERALDKLDNAVALMQQRELSDLEKQGLIQAFEFTYELAWNMLKDYLDWQGINNIVGSRDTIRESFKLGLIADGHTWMEMLQDRNRTSHTYNEKIANEIIENIQQHHAEQLNSLRDTFVKIRNEQA
ncbi:nucleotidyltransferase substrate binding protein [Thiohalophilus sp.]|uniref:nucleotidyltransferase substrate binding protein n=1 Tax=Thiohalophilus sp. TaxID=3028392 RepID=UPI0039752FBA